MSGIFKRHFFMLLFLIVLVMHSVHGQELCIQADTNQITGVKDNYHYELWNQYSKGKACMTLGEGALFSGEWSNIVNYLARRGLRYDQTQTHREIGQFSTKYNCNYHPSDKRGNSYLAVYGWTVDPLVEYYIVEDWCNWNPSMDKNADFLGTIHQDDGEYDIYVNKRVNQPSIVGDTTFIQVFSIRKDTRCRGKIDITKHFEIWEDKDIELGKIHEVSFVVEGFKSSGYFDFEDLIITIE